MSSSSGRWLSRLGQNSRLRVGGEIRVVITFLVLLFQVTSSCIVSKFEYEGTLAQPWPLGNCTGFYCFSRTLFCFLLYFSRGVSSGWISHDNLSSITHFIKQAGYRGSSYSLWRVSVFCPAYSGHWLNAFAPEIFVVFFLCEACTWWLCGPGCYSMYSWALRSTLVIVELYLFQLILTYISALIVLMILLTQLMLIWWILHDNVLQCRFQRFKSLLVQSFYLLPTLNFCCVLLVRGIGWLDLSSWSMTGLSWSTWTNSSKLWKMVSWLVCMRSHL